MSLNNGTKNFVPSMFNHSYLKIEISVVNVHIVLLCKLQKKKGSSPAPVITKNRTPIQHTSKILLLKVNYIDYVFEGGKEIALTQTVQTSDSIPFRINYISPGDLGGISVYHKLTNDSLFDGSIIWMGRGKINYPAQMDTSTVFIKTGNFLMQPENTRFQNVYFNYPSQNAEINKLWNAIGNLQITKDYLFYNKKIAFYCYTPSIGIGNPAEWDWLVFMSN